MTGRRGNARPVARLAGLLALVAAMLGLPGCGGGGIPGTYVAVLEAPDEADAGEVMTFTLELAKDGVAIMTIRGPDGQSAPPITGTYTVDGDRVTTRLDNDEDVLTVKGGTLTMDFFGETLTFRK